MFNWYSFSVFAANEQPDDVDCVRRSIELAALRLNAVAADMALVDELFAEARPHYQDHRCIPQIQLAWLELLASG